MIRYRFIFCILSLLFIANNLVAQSININENNSISDDLIIKPKTDVDEYNKKIVINEEISSTKYGKTKSHNDYKKSSIKQKAIYDINNYGLNTNTPYKIGNYKIDEKKLTLSSEKNNKDKTTDNKFYVMFQINVLFPSVFDLKEPRYFGKELPKLPTQPPPPPPAPPPASPYAGAYNFLPNGTRVGNYSNLSLNNIKMYPYIAFGIRTNNYFRFEIARLSTKIKLQSHKNNQYVDHSYLQGYESRLIEMDFNQQIYFINSYVDLKLSRMWLYLGAGVGVVNNELDKFTMNIEDNNNRYILSSIIDKKAIYKRATMISIGLYSKIYEDTFLDINIKKLSLGKIVTSKDYLLVKTEKSSSSSISDIITMNILEAKINPYLFSIGIRFEF